MQVSIAPSTAAEARLLAAFINDLADLMESGLLPVITDPAPVVAPEEPTAKKSRSKKSAAPEPAPSQPTSTGPEPTQSDSSPVEAGNESAATATEPATSSSEATENTEASEASPSASPVEVSVDDLRVAFGELTQRGLRDKAVAIVRSFKANGLAEVKECDRAAVLAKFKEL